jgi:excisionase family DNA binding protein
MTLEEVAEYLRVHPSTIYRLLKKQQIPAFKVGSDWRFNLASIDRWRVQQETDE